MNTKDHQNISESSSDEMELHIVETETPTKNKRKRRKHEIEFDDSASSQLDKTIEETIAKCKNLTKETARTLLCKLVKNDHVLALALLKAEEENADDERENDKKSEADAPVTPKLTRLKAKQLNKQLPIPGSLLDHHEPDEEVVKLIQEELKSDEEEEDEEYQPDNDSDGDITNTTFSDIDSQPSTPGSALVNNEDIDSPLKNSDFKVPRTPLSAEEQENISRRTRSKLDLQTTSIETIESTFIPPDIDYDLYYFDQDFENEEEWEWKDFLNKYNLPIQGIDDEKEDETDPEYIAAEPIPIDKEELRSVRVPKKELNDLISELFEDSSTLFSEPSTSSIKNKSHDSSKNPKRQKFTPSKTNKYPTTRISSRTYSPAELNTPPHHSEPPTDLRKQLETTPDQHSLSSHCYYSPNQITPQRNILQSPVQQFTSPNVNIQAPQVVQPQTITLASSPTKILQNSPSVLVVNQNQLEVRPLSDQNGTFNSNSIVSQGYFLNGMYTLPQYQSVVIQVPTIDLLQNGINFELTQKHPENDNQVENSSSENCNNLTDDTKRQFKHNRKLKSFEYLHEIKPKKIEVDESIRGFSNEQKLIFEQQFRMHAQMLAVDFVQFYAHPFWWQQAEKCKNNLQQLKEVCCSSHVEECLKLCNEWEEELQENNERNKKYIQFLHEEVEYDQKAFKISKPFKGRFHNRLMEHILKSKAIIYPSLLPHQPYRAIKFTKVFPTNSELSMIAIGYEHAYEKIYKELNSFNPIRIRKPKTASIISTIKRTMGSFRNEDSLKKVIETFKSHPMINPIQFYFIHKKAPPVSHDLIDVSHTKAPKYLTRGVLPRIWETYKFSYERLQIYPFKDSEESENQIINIKITVFDEEIPKEVEESEIVTNYVCENEKIIPKIKNSTRTKEEKQQNLTSILKKVSNNNPSKKKSVNFLLPAETPQKVSCKFKDRLRRAQPSQKFFNIIQEFFLNYTKRLKKSNRLIQIVFIRFRSFDVYWKLIRAMISNKKSKTDGNDVTVTKPKKQITSEEYSKRINRKLADNRAMIMQNMKNENFIEKDCSYAYNFLERVKKTLIESGDDALYIEFMKILTTFNSESESVPELYCKLENLLMPNYADLVDLFLTFLLPEHAAEIGKFCEHFLLTRMSELIHNLNFYFQKQPSHMKKIYACLNELSNDSDLSLEKLKSKILPLLKGNQLLIDWFLGIFEAPTSSNDEYETLHLKKQLNDMEVCDYSYEEMQSQDLDLVESDDNFSSCGVKYINGKIMYRCKTLLPAKISFLAGDLTDEKLSQIKEEKTSTWCVHEIRKHVQFSDKANESNGEINEKSQKKKKLNKKYKTCDAQTLHAHAVRLNSIHAQSGEKISDVLQILENNSNLANGSHESPKKNNCKASKKSNSPKKALTKSPSSSSEASSVNLSPSPSKALQTSKKLRSILDDSEDEIKRAKKLKTIDLSSDDSDVSFTKESSGVEAWTRDEDKLILEEIKRDGKCDKDEIVNNLIPRMERRSRKEIFDRFEFLLNFLTHLPSTSNE